MALRVYVAMPFELRTVAVEVHDRLRGLGIEPTARWVYHHFGSAAPPREVARDWAQKNDEDIARSHALLVVAEPGRGGEMFAEIARGLLARTPIVWVGRRILSAHRDGVLLAPSVDEAIAVLVSWSEMTQPRKPHPTSQHVTIKDLCQVRERIWSAVVEADEHAAQAEKSSA